MLLRASSIAVCTVCLLGLPAPATADDAAAAPPSTQITIAEEPAGIDPVAFLPEAIVAPGTVDLSNTSLSELTGWVQTATGFQVLLDAKALTELGYTAGEPVSDRLENEPVYLLLNRLHALRLGWKLRDGVITVTSREQVIRDLQTESLNLGDLLDQGYSAESLLDAIENHTGEEAGGPWLNVHGTGGTLQLLGDVLFVRQNAPTLREVQGLLLALKAPARRTFILDTPENQQIRARLRENADAAFDGTPLIDAVNTLAAQTGLDIRLDMMSLRHSRVREREPVSLELTDRPLEVVLLTLLSPHELDWSIDDGVLWITSRDYADGQLKTAVYDVRDLCRDDGESEQLAEAVTGQTTGEWLDIHGSGGRISFPKPGAMVVTQNERNHQEVLTLLESYRVALRNSKPRPPQVVNQDEIVTRYYKMTATQAADLMIVLPQLVLVGSWEGEIDNAPGQLRLVSTETRVVNASEIAAATAANKSQPLPVTESRAVLIVRQTRRGQDEVVQFLRKLESGDALLLQGEEPFYPGGGGGGGFNVQGGFGGGFFSVE
jgi:hypothetical protein